MVTEAVETLQDTILQSHGQMLGAGQLSLLHLGHVQVGSVPAWEQGDGGVGIMAIINLVKMLYPEVSRP